MELIKIKRLSNKFGGLIKTQADLEDALGVYSYNTQEMYLNTAQIRSISDIKTCKNIIALMMYLVIILLLVVLMVLYIIFLNSNLVSLRNIL